MQVAFKCFLSEHPGSGQFSSWAAPHEANVMDCGVFIYVFFNVRVQVAQLEQTCQSRVLNFHLSSLKAKPMYSSFVRFFQ